MNNICWFTGLSFQYYNKVGKHSLKRWDLLDEDKIIFTEPNFPKKLNYLTIDLDAAYKEIDRAVLQKIINTKGHKYFKFFKKALTVYYGLKTLSEKYKFLIWLDADVYIKEKFDVKNFLPNQDQLYSSILKTRDLPDSGWLAVNTRHDLFPKFILDYINYYFNDKIFTLPHPWDAYILQDYSKNIPWRNLWLNRVRIKDDKTCGFYDTELEPFLVHYWGDRKKNLPPITDPS